MWQLQNDPVCLWSSLWEHKLEENCLSVWIGAVIGAVVSGRYVTEDSRRGGTRRRGGRKMRGGKENEEKRERSGRVMVVVEGGGQGETLL